MNPLIPLADEVNVNDIHVGEAFQSGSFTREEGENQSVSIKFIITGAVDAYPAYIALINHLRSNYWSDDWGCCAAYNLPLQNISLSSLDCNYAYEATATFKLPQQDDYSSSDSNKQGTSYNNPVINEPTFQMPEVEPNDFQYAVAGEQTHITRGFKTQCYWAVSTPINEKTNYGGFIGWNGEGFDGVDIMTSVQSFSVGISAPKTWMTDTYRNLLAQYANSVNYYPWAGYPTGSVLFKGATINSVAMNYTDISGNSIKDWYWRLRFDFEAREPGPIYHPNYDGGSATSSNQWLDWNNNTVSPSVIKEGYQYVWYTFNREAKGGAIAPNIKQMCLVDVYDKYDFTNLDIPGLVSEYPD